MPPEPASLSSDPFVGLLELFAAEKLCDALALEGHETLIRVYGAREVATGVAILASHDATPWIAGRIDGDLVDLATLAAGASSGHGDQRSNVALALVAVAGAAALDVICLRGLKGEKGGLTTAIADIATGAAFRVGPLR